MNTKHNHTVLIIDDEEFILSSLNRLLRNEFNVLIASSGQEGLVLMQSHEVHVVVSDQRMPGMIGVDFLAKVKGEFPDAIRMLLTGYSDIESVISAINTGNIYRYLVKPWNPDEFLSTIREACVKYDLIFQNRKLTQELINTNIQLEERVKDRTARLTRTSNLLTSLNHIATQLQGELKLENTLAILSTELEKINFDNIVAFVKPQNAKTEVSGEIEEESLFENHLFIEDPFTDWLSETLQGFFINDMHEWKKSFFSKTQTPMPKSLESLNEIPFSTSGIFLPLHARRGFIGIMILWGQDINEDDLAPFSMFANQLAVILENVEFFRSIKKLAETDSLTGLLNRYSFIEIADHEFKRSKRMGSSLAVIMIDVDRFKQVNDTYGHIIGDKTLQFIARRMKMAVRKDVDYIGRFGGDEFAVLLPESDAVQAQSIAQRLQDLVESENTNIPGGPLNVEISLGVAWITEKVESLDALLDQADQNMYSAKKERKS
jgi:diguanylate cyclase (GGDEF)-like protein